MAEPVEAKGEKLEEWEWAAPRTRPHKYPWNKWMDGSIWRIVKGKDYEVADEIMVTQIRNRGLRDHGIPPRVAKPMFGVIVFQAIIGAGDGTQ